MSVAGRKAYDGRGEKRDDATSWRVRLVVRFAANGRPLPQGGGDRNHQRGQLEAEDRRELHASRAAAAQEWIADTDIASSSDGIGACADLLIITVSRKA